jgi:hypothetical protein
MPAPIIDPRTATLTLLEELIVTLALLEANPLTAAFAPAFEELYKNDWHKLTLDEFTYLVAAYRADALVATADDVLDDFVDDLDKILLRKVKNNRDDTLYAYYLGAKRPFELKRPVLGGQLDIMVGWVERLKGSSDSELAALGARLETLVTAANAAL